jgi:hypothetical protein
MDSANIRWARPCPRTGRALMRRWRMTGGKRYVKSQPGLVAAPKKPEEDYGVLFG